MNWIKINFCNNKNCKKDEHKFIQDNKVCDDSLPKNWCEILVSDGKKVSLGKAEVSIHYCDRIELKNVKYWMSLDDIPLPKGD